ncbi:MAG TPA: AsnC family transcriptional regulator [Armatimonadota bacterium]|jgi:DNA-binding Lrp family transcriptional regulator
MLNALDRRIISRLSGDIGEGRYPFAELAAEIGITEVELLKRLKDFQERGILRRFGAILRHQAAGISANGMSVWSVPDADAERLGTLMAGFPEVSHCYQRPRMPHWPYNLFAMIHGRSEEECRAVADRIAAATGLSDYKILFSIHEFKKTSMAY